MTAPCCLVPFVASAVYQGIAHYQRHQRTRTKTYCCADDPFDVVDRPSAAPRADLSAWRRPSRLEDSNLLSGGRSAGYQRRGPPSPGEPLHPFRTVGDCRRPRLFSAGHPFSARTGSASAAASTPLAPPPIVGVRPPPLPQHEVCRRSFAGSPISGRADSGGRESATDAGATEGGGSRRPLPALPPLRPCGGGQPWFVGD